MEVIVMLIVGGLMGWLCSSMADNRNRSALGWFMGGFFFGILAVILLACLGELKPTPTVEEVEALLNKETK